MKLNNTFAYILTFGLLMMGGAVMGQHVTVNGSVFGGGNLANVKGSSTVTIDQASAEIGNDVYGGGAKAHVNSADGTNPTDGATTSVTLTQGNVTGSVYGGGLGDLASLPGTGHEDIEALVFGPVTVTINGGTVGQSVFGCNNYNGAPKSTVVVDVNGGSIGSENNNATGHVYGGGNLAAYIAPAGTPNYPVVNINNGTMNNVFGGGNGDPNDPDQETAMVTGNPQVTIGDDNSEHSAIVRHDVYGGGNAAKVTGNTKVTYNDNGANTKVDKLFGGGNAAGVTGTATIDMTLGKVVSGIYGGCNTEGTVTGNITVNVTGGQIGTDAEHTANIHGGGYGNNTSTSGNVTVNFGTSGDTHTSTPSLYGDVYGGSGFGNVNDEASDETTVNIVNGEINGDVYGGGLGQKSDDPDLNYEALVNGVVTVNIGASTGETPTYSGKASITGEVFGCNNANGTPKDNVFVNIYMTHHTDGETAGVDDNRYPVSLVSLSDDEQLAAFMALPSTDAQYALKAVYGGGNLAKYEPGTGKKTTVHVYQCDENTVKTVYGGCNAADATDVMVIIDGGRFDQVFGGGNGAGNDNPGANISGTATSRIHGGLFNQLFGGSDTKGDVHVVDLAIDNASGCLELIKESFGGANKAVIHGNVSTTLACSQIQIGSFYGGSNLADIIDGSVTLNVYGGIYNNVFGGSKGDLNEAANILGNVTLNLYGGSIVNAFGGSDVNGNITGKITVNMLDNEVDNCELSITNIYGGGRDAAYTPVLPSGIGVTNYLSPEVNLIHGTVSGFVYGGGLGSTATVSASPVVIVGSTPASLPMGQSIPSSPSVIVGNDVYGGGEEAPVAGNTSVTIQNSYSSVDGMIFGGGKQASVGNASVNVNGGKVGAGVYGGCNVEGTVGGLISTNTCTVNIDNNTTPPTKTLSIATDATTVYDGASTVNMTSGTVGTTTDHANVYGGGLGALTNVYGTVALEANGSTIYGDVYGGSAKGLVNCTKDGDDQSHTPGTVTGVTITSGVIDGDVYGGGHGIDDAPAHVYGPVQVTVNGGSMTNVFGCNNAAGAPQSTVQVDINKGTGTMSVNNVYGGGNQASYSAASTDTQNYPVVNIINGTVANVFGGGYAAAVTGNPQVTIGDAVEGHCAIVSGNVFGGGDAAKVMGSTTVEYKDNNSNSRVGNIFGGGNNITESGQGVSGSTTVTMTSGNLGEVTSNVYGGCNTSGTVQNTTNVEIKGGTVHGSVFGGGYGASTVVTGTANVEISGSSAVDNDVYGGGDQGVVNGGTVVNVKAN